MDARIVEPHAAAATLRVARPEDLPALEQFIGALSLRSRVQRFFAPLRSLPEPMRQAIARRDPSQRFVVAEHGAALVALGQYAADAARRRCEVALAVADGWQGRGLGPRLLDWLLDDAARAGLREAVMETLADNQAMQSLARRAGFKLVEHPEDPDLVFGQRALAAPRINIPVGDLLPSLNWPLCGFLGAAAAG